MKEDNVHSSNFNYLIEIIYQIPYQGYNIKYKIKLGEVHYLIQVNFKTIKEKDYGTLDAKLS